MKLEIAKNKAQLPESETRVLFDYVDQLEVLLHNCRFAVKLILEIAKQTIFTNFGETVVW